MTRSDMPPLDADALKAAMRVAEDASRIGFATTCDVARKAIKEYLWHVHPENPERLAREAYEVGE